MKSITFSNVQDVWSGTKARDFSQRHLLCPFKLCDHLQMRLKHFPKLLNMENNASQYVAGLL